MVTYAIRAQDPLGIRSRHMPADATQNEATIKKLYDGLDTHDGEAMASCYAADAHFSDPVFPELTGSQAGDMWRMLTSRATDLSVELPEAKADAEAGSALWVATYTFGATGRNVVNRVRSSFKFDDKGLIAEQQDDFPFWKWSRQALGLPGLTLGWTPMLRSKVRANAAAELARFRADQEAFRCKIAPPAAGRRGRVLVLAVAQAFASEKLLDVERPLLGALDDGQEIAHQRDFLDLFLQEPLEELLALEVVRGARDRGQLVELPGHLPLLVERHLHGLDEVGEAPSSGAETPEIVASSSMSSR